MSYPPPPDPSPQTGGQPLPPPPYPPQAAPPPSYGAPPPGSDPGQPPVAPPQGYGYPPPDYGPPPPQGYGYPAAGYGYGAPPPQWQGPGAAGAPKRGQSLCGAAGIGLGILGILLIGATVVMMMPTALQNPGQMPDQNDPQVQRLGMIMQAGMCMNFLGLVVASCGFLEKDRGRLTIWAAYVVNGFPCVCTCASAILGAIILGAGLS